MMVESEARWEKWVMTTFESVEALWESEWRTWKPGRTDLNVAPPLANPEEAENPFAQASQGEPWLGSGSPKNVGVDVDERILSSQDIDQIVEQERPELADDEKNYEGEEVLEEEDGTHHPEESAPVTRELRTTEM